MQKPLAFQSLAQLLLNAHEHLGIDRFQLNFGLVSDEVAVVCNVVCGFIDRVKHQLLLRGQRMKGARADFNENQVVVLETDQMTVSRDAQSQLVKIASIGACRADFEELWVNTTGKEVKIQLGNFWPDG